MSVISSGHVIGQLIIAKERIELSITNLAWKGGVDAACLCLLGNVETLNETNETHRNNVSRVNDLNEVMKVLGPLPLGNLIDSQLR